MIKCLLNTGSTNSLITFEKKIYFQIIKSAVPTY